MNFFFDSYAIIEIIKNNDNYNNFKNLIMFTTSINIAEVYYSLLNNAKEELATELVNSLNVQLLNINKEQGIKAAKLKFKYKKEKLSYTDCIGYIIAKELNMKFLTGDEKFRNKENVEFVK